jgi:dynein heavy chain
VFMCLCGANRCLVSVGGYHCLQEQDSAMRLQQRYRMGVKSIFSAEKMVSSMQLKLQELQPVLDRNQEETRQMMVSIEEQQAKINDSRLVMEAEQQACLDKALAAHRMKMDCESDLAKAMPELDGARCFCMGFIGVVLLPSVSVCCNWLPSTCCAVAAAATEALKTLTPADIAVVRSMLKPPAGVKLVVEAVAIMLKVEPVKAMSSDGVTSRWDYWEPAKKTLLNDPRFLKRLLTFKRDKISDSLVTKIQVRRRCGSS